MTTSSRLTAPQRLTIGSLFAGIGGLELGLERAGLGPVKWQVEINPYCRAVLAKHWPEAVRYEDVRSVRGSAVAPVDVICGGFPCQGISAAGKGAGLEDPRSGLWSEYARIVGEVRPRFVVVENSPLLARRGLDRVLADLASLGFDAEWFPLAARDVGAPHGRERLFVVGHANGGGLGSRTGLREEGAWSGRGLPEHSDCTGLAHAVRLGLEGEQQAGAASRAAVGGGERLADPVCVGSQTWEAGGLQGQGEPRSDDHGRHRFPPRRRDAKAWRAYSESGGPQPGLHRGPHGFLAGVDAPRIEALGNAVVPQVAEVVGHVVLGIDARLRGVTQ